MILVEPAFPSPGRLLCFFQITLTLLEIALALLDRRSYLGHEDSLLP